MPRRPRSSLASAPVHVLNRGSHRTTLFRSEDDYAWFEALLADAKPRFSVKFYAWCLMPNHWHLFVDSREPNHISRLLHRVTTLHAQRVHEMRGTRGLGPIYQGRFRSFPVSTDSSFYRLCRYIERNAARAHLSLRASDWRWSSLWWRERAMEPNDLLDPWPIPHPPDWIDVVESPDSREELRRIRACVKSSAPLASPFSLRTSADVSRRASVKS